MSHHLSDGSWLNTTHNPMTESDARRLVIAELGGVWTATRVDGAAFCASTLAHAVHAGDLTAAEAEALLRYTSSEGPRPTWLRPLVCPECKDSVFVFRGRCEHCGSVAL